MRKLDKYNDFFDGFILFAVKGEKAYLLGKTRLNMVSLNIIETENVLTSTNSIACKTPDIKIPCGYCTLLLSLATKYTNIFFENEFTTMILMPDPYIAGVTCYYKSKIYNDMLVFYYEDIGDKTPFQFVLEGEEIFLETPDNLNTDKPKYIIVTRKFIELYAKERRKLLKMKFLNIDKVQDFSQDFKVGENLYHAEKENKSSFIFITKRGSDSKINFTYYLHSGGIRGIDLANYADDVISILVDIGVNLIKIQQKYKLIINSKKYVKYENIDLYSNDLHELLVEKDIMKCNLSSREKNAQDVYIRKDIVDLCDPDLKKNKLYNFLIRYAKNITD